jgi:hypothetical protein
MGRRNFDGGCDGGCGVGSVFAVVKHDSSGRAHHKTMALLAFNGYRRRGRRRK